MGYLKLTLTLTFGDPMGESNGANEVRLIRAGGVLTIGILKLQVPPNKSKTENHPIISE